MLSWIRLGAVMMFLGVAIGAFGAHALKNLLSEPAKATFEVGVRYQLIHGLALFVVAWLASRNVSSQVIAAGWLFTAGIFLFSGSLYILSLTGIKAWGAVTPLGGLCFLMGWVLVFLARI